MLFNVLGPENDVV